MIDIEDLESEICDRFGEGGRRWKFDIFERDSEPGSAWSDEGIRTIKVRILVEPYRLFPVKLGGVFVNSSDLDLHPVLLPAISDAISQASGRWPMRDTLWSMEDEDWDRSRDGRVGTMLGMSHSLAGWLGDPEVAPPSWWEYMLTLIRQEMNRHCRWCGEKHDGGPEHCEGSE